MQRELDVAWAAGLFEGEGCFYEVVLKPSGFIYLGATIEMTDLPVMERFLSVLKANGVGPKTRITSRWRGNENHSRQYAIKLTGTQAEALYEILRDQLGPRRRQKADMILSHRAEQRNAIERTVTCRCGTVFEASIRGPRAAWCSTACRDSFRAKTERGREMALGRSRRYRERQRALRMRERMGEAA